MDLISESTTNQQAIKKNNHNKIKIFLRKKEVLTVGKKKGGTFGY